MEYYFERIWNNEDAMYTVDLEEFQDSHTWWQRWIYTLSEIYKSNDLLIENCGSAFLYPDRQIGNWPKAKPQ